MSQFRIGNGLDVHRFDSHGESVILGGVEIPHTSALLAHSDGDVLTHALMDAMLGALALGDIGHHFPDTDDAYRGISSMELLARVNTLIADSGWCLCNADITVIAQLPRLSPHIMKMRQSIALTLGVAEDQVSVKATTSEHLGFTGREEGIAVMASVLLSTQ